MSSGKNIIEVKVYSDSKYYVSQPLVMDGMLLDFNTINDIKKLIEYSKKMGWIK